MGESGVEPSRIDVESEILVGGNGAENAGGEAMGRSENSASEAEADDAEGSVEESASSESEPSRKRFLVCRRSQLN